jgi:arginine dihydrolase
MIYRSTHDLDFCLDDVPACPIPARVLMTSPDHFEVSYVINPHMAGHIGSVDAELARKQWDVILKTYRDLGIDVHTVAGLVGLPDMVFCANQTLPYIRARRGDAKGVVLSKMFAEQRMAEVDRYADFFTGLGFETLPLGEQARTSFEGMGDAIWHPSRYLLWGGYGFRTDVNVYDLIRDALDVRVILIELTDPDFYHLDTCLSALDEKTAVIYPGAFTPEGLDLVKSFFPNLIESPEDEARKLFSCNAHSPDGKHVIIQQGCTVTNRALTEAGFVPLEVDTSEFLKAGGSVFCMKQMFW